MFKCRHKSRFKLSRLEATEAPTLDNSRDIDAGWFALEMITLFQYLLVLYDGEIYVEEEILGHLDINSELGFLNSGVVNSLWLFWG